MRLVLHRALWTSRPALSSSLIPSMTPSPTRWRPGAPHEYRQCASLLQQCVPTLTSKPGQGSGINSFLAALQEADSAAA